MNFWRSTLLTCSAFLFTSLMAPAVKADEETAPYTTTKEDGKFSVRSYPELSVASTSKSEDAKSRDQRFMQLFGYISGKNEAKEKIEMTTPVFMEGAEMRFVMPQKVKDKGAPASTNQAVKVATLPGRKVAVYQFSGWSNAKLEEKATAQLREWMKAQKLEASGEPFFAYYNPPWTLGPLRRNEVLIPLK